MVTAHSARFSMNRFDRGLAHALMALALLSTFLVPWLAKHPL